MVGDHLSAKVLDAQRRVFRLAARDHDLSLKAISIGSNINYDTLRTYSSGHTAMPFTAFLKLVDTIPDYLLSQMLVPAGRTMVPLEDSDGDLDELGREAAGFLHDYVDAKSDGRVTPIEHAKLSERAVRVASAAAKVRAA